MDNQSAMYGQLDEYLGKPLQQPIDGFLKPGNCLPHAIASERHIQLAALTLYIANVDSAIQKLVALRAQLEESTVHVRQSLLALTSPVLRVPPEILGEIFYHCLPQMPYITPSDVNSPIVLTQVCRHWRAVAVSTPRLWSSLSIHLQKTICEKYRRGCETWLSRAKSVPLSVRVLNDIGMFAADHALPPMLHWLKPLMAHCSDLWWHGPSLSPAFFPETEPELDLPLQRLRITSHHDTPSIQFPGPTKRLRSASLQCLNHDLQSLDDIGLPWDNLVDLNMHFGLFGSALFLQLLTRCSHLRTLVVSCLCADNSQLGILRASSPGLITHHTLRRLEIKVIRAGLDMIFEALTLPVLEELDVTFCCRERDIWPHTSFLEMVWRSQCSLKRLTVRSNKNAVPHFEEYLEAIPGLAVFTSAPDPLFR